MKGPISIMNEIDGTDWKLSVAVNWVGKQDGVFAQPKTGLGRPSTCARPKRQS